jgi:hypothetical protein
VSSYLTPHIGVINQSTVVTDQQVADALPAMQYQISYHLRPWWGVTGTILQWPKGSAVPTDKDFWAAYIFDDSDQAGALGYHETDSNDRPDLRVFAKTDRQYGLSWTVTLSHEYLEELVDPWIQALWQVSDVEGIAAEVGDPVEADGLGYLITRSNGVPVLVSDFITPRWFDPGLVAGPFDYKGHCSKPLQVTAGGYISICRPVSGKFSWTEYQQQKGQLVAVDTADPDDLHHFHVAANGDPDTPGRTTRHPRFRDRRRGPRRRARPLA